jgi:diguanylate cyclase (GGDEF)-like protein
MQVKRLCCALAIGTAILITASTGRAADSGGRWDKFADTVFQHIAQDADLPNAAIPTAICEDGEGFMWFGSQNGLARWDGYRFRSYQSDPAIAGTLPDNYINTLHRDIQGRLWIGTNSGGLALYDPDHDRFTTYAAGPHGLSHVRVMGIADDGAGALWVATDGGLDHLDIRTGEIRQNHHRDGDAGSLPANHVSAVLMDSSGVLWVGTSQGLVRSRADAQSFTPVPLPAPKKSTAAVRALFQDSGGRVWIGTSRQGAYVIDPHAGSTRPVIAKGPDRAELQSETIVAIAEARPNEMWLGTSSEGIVALDPDTLQTKRIRHDPALPSSLGDDTVWVLERDRSGLMWVGTSRTLSRHDPRQDAALTVFGGSSRKNGLSEANVYSILPGPDGHIWLGLGNNGVDRLDPVTGLAEGLRPDPAGAGSARAGRRRLSKSPVDAAALSASGEVYLGTRQGLYRIDRAARNVFHVPLAAPDPATEVWTLLRAGHVLWIGGVDGLWQLDLDAGAGAPVRAVDMTQFTDRRVTSIEPGLAGDLWIGTENGINRFDPISHAVERILPDRENPAGLPARLVNSSLFDRHGRLWVATAGGGISVLVERESGGRPRFRRLGMASGLPNDDVDKLLLDHAGNVWASTDNGLAVIDPETFAVRALGRADGVVISNYWANSGVTTPQGEVLFGGIGGLTVIRPERLTSWTYRPMVVVTDLRIGGRPGTVEGKPLEVTPEANSIAVEFSALDYSAPERCRYSYRLDGYDDNWIDTDATHRVAIYTNLPPRNYVLRIRGSNRDGTWSDKVLSLPFRVLPAWYQTLWFRLIESCIVFALIVMLVRGFTGHLRRRQRELERCVAERTAELEESQRQLERFAYYDFLTGLPNRRMFTDDFRKALAIARRRDDHFALLLLDLDAFKQINDTYGHDAGDALLIEVANRLRSAVREADSVARLGGDEFAILLVGDHDYAAIEHVCERIIESFLHPVPFEGAEMTASLSIGVSIFPDHGETQDSLYKLADVALYEAKRTGRNPSIWSPMHSDLESVRPRS